jgi:hypothetical protein
MSMGVERSVVASQVVDHQRATELRGFAVVEGSKDDRRIPECVRESGDFGIGRLLLPERNMMRRP